MNSLTLHIPHLDALLKGVEAEWRDQPSVSAEVAEGLSLPSLKVIKARGHRESLAQPFEGIATPEQASYLAAKALPDYDAAQLWFAFDWAHWIANRDDMVLMADLEVSAAEQQLILALLNTHFASQGLHFLVDAQGRGFIRVANAPEASFYAASRVKGEAVTPYMPNAAYWRAILNEIQMLFYPHEFNLAREMRNQPTINSLWIWTPDETPLVLASGWTHLMGDESSLPLLESAQGLSYLQDVTSWPQLTEALMDTPTAQAYFQTNVITENLSNFSLDFAASLLKDMEANWFAPAKKAVEQKQLNRLEISWGTSQRLVYQAAHGWRFWRRHQGWGV